VRSAASALPISPESAHHAVSSALARVATHETSDRRAGIASCAGGIDGPVGSHLDFFSCARLAGHQYHCACAFALRPIVDFINLDMLDANLAQRAMLRTVCDAFSGRKGIVSGQYDW
jgi:hypothetical protein